MYFKMIAQFLEGSSPPTKNTPSHCAPPSLFLQVQ